MINSINAYEYHQIALPTLPQSPWSQSLEEVYRVESDKWSIQISDMNLNSSFLSFNPEAYFFDFWGGDSTISPGPYSTIQIQTEDRKKIFFYSHIHYSTRYGRNSAEGIWNWKGENAQIQFLRFIQSATNISFDMETHICHHPQLGSGKWRYSEEHWVGELGRFRLPISQSYSLSLSIDFENNDTSWFEKCERMRVAK